VKNFFPDLKGSFAPRRLRKGKFTKTIKTSKLSDMTTLASSTGDMGQIDPINEMEGREVTAESVNERLDDWLQRLNALFAQIKTWAASIGWTVEDGAPILMHEEMMQRFGIADRSQPTLRVKNSDGAEIWIKPKGLWVIGANGRVDMYSRKGAFALVNVADVF
jgi:hypothetical protein